MGVTHHGALNLPVLAVTASTLAVTPQMDRVSINLNRAAGIAVTLPKAVGSGLYLRFFVGATITSNSTTIKVANSTDIMQGNCLQSQDGGATLQMFETAADSDTITMNGSTTSGIVGDFIELVDIASGLWMVRMVSAATGTEATPFSATV